MKYFVFPANFFGVTPAVHLLLPRLNEAFAIFGKPEPKIERENGKNAVALWSTDEEVETALRNAADMVEEELSWNINSDHQPYKVTDSITEMKEMVHGPLTPE